MRFRGRTVAIIAASFWLLRCGSNEDAQRNGSPGGNGAGTAGRSGASTTGGNNATGGNSATGGTDGGTGNSATGGTDGGTGNSATGGTGDAGSTGGTDETGGVGGSSGSGASGKGGSGGSSGSSGGSGGSNGGSGGLNPPGGAGGQREPEATLTDPSPGAWPMWKRSLDHAGAAVDMSGGITAGNKCVRWDKRVSGPGGFGASSAVVARIQGRWTVFAAVNGGCDDSGSCSDSGGSVYAFDGDTGTRLWRAGAPNGSVLNPYAPLVADIDDDGAFELVTPSPNGGYLYAFRVEEEPGGPPGSVQWAFEYDGMSETAVAAANFDDDPALEIVFGNDTGGNRAAEVFLLDGVDGTLQDSFPVGRRSTRDSGCDAVDKADSGGPAVSVVGGSRTIFVGAWDGGFYALRWGGSSLTQAWRYDMPLDSALTCPIPKVRNSPLVADLEGGPTVVLSYMYEELQSPAPSFDVEEQARTVFVDATDGTPRAAPFVTGAWKSSPSAGDLDPNSAGLEVAMAGFGDIRALTASGSALWAPVQAGSAANRSSATITDIDGDGDLDVLVGIEGVANGLAAIDGTSGDLLWSHATGSDGLVATPVAADVDGDGSLEVVVHTLDGRLFVLDNACP